MAGAPSLRSRLMNMSDLLVAMANQQPTGNRVQTFYEGNFLVQLLPAALFVPVVTYTLSAHQAGQVEGFTFGCEVISDFDLVTWQLQIDGAPYQGFDNIQGPQSTFVFPKILADPIPIRAGATIRIAAKTTVATLGNIAAACLGSYWAALGPEVQSDPAGHVTAQL